MFMSKIKIINYKKVAVSVALIIALCVVGILWIDKTIYLRLRNFDWVVWGWMDVIFATKIWLVASLFFACGYAITTNRDSLFVIRKNPGAMVFLSVAIASIIGGLLKLGLGRMRPVFYDALGQVGFYPFTADWAFNSMPSGHTTASFAGLVMIGILFPRIKWATWAIAIIIGLSRICYGAHWPTDVILGAFIGIAVANIFYKAIKNQ
jgi:membrane-associated phospholipid phosphatase